MNIFFSLFCYHIRLTSQSHISLISAHYRTDGLASEKYEGPFISATQWHSQAFSLHILYSFFIRTCRCPWGDRSWRYWFQNNELFFFILDLVRKQNMSCHSSFCGFYKYFVFRYQSTEKSVLRIKTQKGMQGNQLLLLNCKISCNPSSTMYFTHHKTVYTTKKELFFCLLIPVVVIVHLVLSALA